MPKVKSLGGGEIDISADDFALVTLMGVVARPLSSDIEGVKLIGPENAVLIRDALKAAGFTLTYSD